MVSKFLAGERLLRTQDATDSEEKTDDQETRVYTGFLTAGRHHHRHNERYLTAG